MVTDLHPVRRILPVRVRLAIWLVIDAAVLWYLYVWGFRRDWIAQMDRPAFFFEVAVFIVASIMIAILALRAAVPGREPNRAEAAMVAVVLLVSILMVMRLPADTNLPFSRFIKDGMRCFRDTFILAVVPWFALLWAVKRGAPMRRGTAAGLAAGAALLFTFAILRIGCPIDEQLHLLIWHLALPGIVGIGASIFVAALWIRGRRVLPAR
jgi:hypothetical protein